MNLLKQTPTAHADSQKIALERGLKCRTLKAVKYTNKKGKPLMANGKTKDTNSNR